MNISMKSYIESLPKKRMGAGCLLFDEQGRLLLVKPTYKSGWEITGGVVELNESPIQCCRREVEEEIGLKRTIGNLLVVDYNEQTNDTTESLMFIFNGGVLSSRDIASIHLCDDELSEFCFFHFETLPSDLSVSLRKRVLVAGQQAKTNTCVYLENQEIICSIL